MSLYWPYFFADYYLALEYLAAITAIIILISSADDLFIDAWFWIRKIRRALTIERYYQPLQVQQLQVQQLQDRPEQHIAIMIPAWLEYDVIAPMLENMVSVLDYRSYMIFVGTYQNDQKTITEVERMRARYRQLVRVEVPHNGPTCKADCLNWVVQAIFRHEQVHGISFAGVILHDSEDVLHPLELKYFNYLLPRMDLIQIPVGSLERHWYELVAGVYMDEFAEWHGKDLVVRESMVGMVPSAGVGTCFSRRALLTLASETDNQPFNTQSLTEDYDIGVRLAAHGMRAIIGRFPVQYAVERRTWFGFGPTRQFNITTPLSVREYFPNTFYTSYRQKARWSLGICFQGWQQFGWHGNIAERYLQLRDRKGIVTSFVAIFAYVLVLQFLMLQIGYMTGWLTASYPPLFSSESWLSSLLWLNAIVLFLRCVQRVYFTQKIFGWEHGLLAVPRLVVGNFVNCMAMARAWKQFMSHLIFGTRLVWDKTMHDFPTGEGLVEDKKRLGELLVLWRAIDEQQLASTLEEQKQSDIPFGRLLVNKGWLDEDTLAEAIAAQAGLERIDLSAERFVTDRALLPPELGIRWRALPLYRDHVPDQVVAIAVAAPLGAVAEAQFRDAVGYVPKQYIARDNDIAEGLRLYASVMTGGEGMPSPGRGVPLLGDLIMERGLVQRGVLEQALQSYSPDRHGPIGSFLVERGIISPEALAGAVAEQQTLMAAVNRMTS